MTGYHSVQVSKNLYCLSSEQFIEYSNISSVTNIIKKIKALPLYHREGFCLVNHNDRFIFLSGGTCLVDGCSVAVDRYSIVEDKWIEVSDLNM